MLLHTLRLTVHEEEKLSFCWRHPKERSQNFSPNGGTILVLSDPSAGNLCPYITGERIRQAHGRSKWVLKMQLLQVIISLNSIFSYDLFISMNKDLCIFNSNSIHLGSLIKWKLVFYGTKDHPNMNDFNSSILGKSDYILSTCLICVI